MVGTIYSGTVRKEFQETMKKQDIILTISLLFIGMALFVGYRLWYHAPGGSVEITIDGTLYQTLSLSEDTTIELPTKTGKNILKIQNGAADMTDADCPDQLCVKQKPISHTGETLVCLPHKLVVKVINNTDDTENIPDRVAH